MSDQLNPSPTTSLPLTPDGHNILHPAAPDPYAEIQLDSSSDIASLFDDRFDDSDLGSDTSSTYSTSITSSILNYKYENGRRYHAYREGSYPLPNDEREQDRMDLHHHVFRLCLDGGLFRAPITANPQRVLDMGTGTGIWAVDFADEFPSALVMGNDLSPIQPTWVPANCKFTVDDLESEWLYKSSGDFDYIHGRGLAGGIGDWHRLYTQAYDHLKPGGWLEMQEYEAWIRSDDDSLDRCPYTNQWLDLLEESSVKYGKKFNVAEEQKEKLIAAGFQDVREDLYKVPMGIWPKDPKMKEIGVYQMEQMCACVEPFTLALLTRILGWTNDECQVLMAGVRREFRDKANHLYVNFHFVYGRRPE